MRDEEQAKELFHDIVVAKSKEIYESIMEDEMMDAMTLKKAWVEQVGDLADEFAEESGVLKMKKKLISNLKNL